MLLSRTLGSPSVRGSEVLTDRSAFISERLCQPGAVRLREWAESQGVHYQTAWKWFRDGTLPVPAVQTASGTILVNPEAEAAPSGGVGLYARVSSPDQRADLDRQLAPLREWAALPGAAGVRAEAAVGSRLHGRRPQLRGELAERL